MDDNNYVLENKRSMYGSIYFRIPTLKHIFVEAPMRFYNKLWWQYMPGVKIEVKWPRGNVVVDHNDPRWIDLGGAVWVDLGFSANPNDHYRLWLEQNVGRQGWDWDWSLENNNAAEDRLTIKIRRGKSKYATIAALKWTS